jgi:uncharacterized protein involved in outer membrane biogenesis
VEPPRHAQGGSEPVVQAQYVRGAISTWALLKGRLHVRRAEADAAVVVAERLADKSIPLLQQLSKGPQPPNPVGGKDKIVLEPPLRIDILRLQNAQAFLRDKAVTPTVDVRMALSMLVSNVGVPTPRRSSACR